MKVKMKTEKIIGGQTVRKNKDVKGIWDIIDTSGGRNRGRVAFTGSMKEVKMAIKLGNK